jgi:hypothetical protein
MATPRKREAKSRWMKRRLGFDGCALEGSKASGFERKYSIPSKIFE